jgi:hypothetical protein
LLDKKSQLFARAYMRACSFVILAALLLLSSAARLQAETITATWNPNPEPNIAGYTLSYGTASGSYTTTVDVGKVTSKVVTVTAGQRYYFAVRAYNTMGLTSAFSTEASMMVAATTAPSIASLSPTTGAAGVVVTIAGANFGSTKGTSTVTFNGIAATPTSWSAASIILPVPTGAATGNVVVTVSGMASNGMMFTVPAANLPPVLTSPGNQTSTVGATVSLQLSATDPNGTALTYSATGLPTGLSINSTTGLISGRVPSSPGTFNATATASDGSLSSSKTFTWTVAAAPAGISLVQHVERDGGTTASTSVAFAAGNTSGNFIAVAVRGGKPDRTLTVSDTSGNVYKQAAWFNNGADDTVGLYYAENVAAGSNTVTVATSNPITLRISLLEYRGVAAANSLDGVRTAAGQSGSPSSGAITTTANGDLLIGVLSVADVTNPTAGSGFALEAAVPALPNAKLVVQDAVQATAGGATAAATMSASDLWGIAIAAFKAAGGPVSPAPNITTLTPATGAVGTAVTIAGSNFGATKGTSTVTFNGTVSTPSSWSATSIVVPVPAGATTGNVVVTVGGVASNAKTFTVTTPQPPAVGISLVQHVERDAGSTSTASLAFPSANASGNFIAVAVRGGIASQTFAVTDTRGNTYRQAVLFNNNTDSTLGIYYAESVGSGANTVTVRLTSATASTLRFSLLEYRGVAASNSLDGVRSASGASTSPSSGAVTTTAGGDLLIGVIGVADVANVTAGSGFALESAVPALPSAKIVVEDGVLATSGSIAATATMSVSDRWGAALAAFKAASGSSLMSLAMMSATEAGPIPNDSSRASDYDGDAKSELVVFTPSSGKWSVLQSSTNYMNSLSVTLGTSADVPVPGDYDGDGKADVAVYTPSTGTWTVLKSSSAYTSSMSTTWGISGDVPVPGDYDGDGKTDFAVYRPSAGQWLLTLSATQTTKTLVLGASGDKPVAGDYDGDGRTDVAVFRPSIGAWTVLTSSSNYASQLTGTIGNATDLLVPGDYDRDGRMDMAVYRPSTGSWLILGSASGYTTSRTVALGSSTDIPVPGDYDADGTTDVAVYQPSTRQWSIVRSSDGSPLTSVWGTSSADVPLPRHP